LPVAGHGTAARHRLIFVRDVGAGGERIGRSYIRLKEGHRLSQRHRIMAECADTSPPGASDGNSF
jgi:hypothetical protein